MKWLPNIILWLSVAAGGFAQTLGPGQSWQYQLLDGGGIMDECPICDRPTFWQPLKGSFDLIGTTTADRYAITNIQFASDYSEKPAYRVTGSGVLSFESGEADVTLSVKIQRAGFADETLRMTNAPVAASRIFPMLSLQGMESPATLTRVYHLQLNAAPIRQLWFSTSSSFTRGTIGIPEEAAISHGDLLSMDGHVVKRNSQLTAMLSIPPGEDIGLDAVDIGPRGEIYFSPTADTESIVNGPIGDGDIVTSGGRLFAQNAQLLSPFGATDPEAGLDAVHLLNEFDVYFSISREVTRAGGKTLKPGDIISSDGRIFRTEADLFLRFNPGGVIGIDALYIWPNGEVWFSPQAGFSANGFTIQQGDILSDQGYIVLRNGDLVGRFAPIEDVADFGLDALTIISDVSVTPGLTTITEVNSGGGGLDLSWEGAGRVFQLERASSVEGPYLPLSDVTPDRTAHDDPPGAAAFYRVRQW